ncbi:hypothetical protein F4819DRAFT_509443 [Hypoxylon fuscum]|nr:hypothetical protein F4819DRAFT_509443 [Hypoxylon fuscum]
MDISNFAGRQDVSSSSSIPQSTLSTGAIAGIAIGGAALIFAALAPLLIKLAKRQDQRRRTRASMFPEAPNLESGTMQEADGERPKRLRKKSFLGESQVNIVDNADDTGREESHSRRSSLQHVSPARTRAGSLSTATGNGNGNGSARGSLDTQIQKQRSPEKQRGYGVYEHRRKSSWIDEDALHGPTVSPKKTKGKEAQKRSVSWFAGSLSRSLSRLSITSGTTERMGSPTLPYTEAQGNQQIDARVKNANEQDTNENSPQRVRPARYTLPAPRSNQQLQVYTSPQKAYIPYTLPTPGTTGTNNVAKSPPDIIQNPRFRNRVSFQAAQHLAGSARLPAPISIPQAPFHRQPILKHSATETELAEILRMTAERLQDGHRSTRRQTLMMPYRPGFLTPGYLTPGVYQSDQRDSYMNLPYEPSSGEVSPVKSHKSAPATMTYAELEGSAPKPPSPQRQLQTPRHSRQISMISMVSEPDSLVASRRESIPDVRTALSSPSRATRSNEPTPSPEGSKQQARPFSNGSSMSSALSTLYSMEEASIRSPPMGDLDFDDSTPMNTPHRSAEKKLSAYEIFNGTPNPEDGDKSPKFRFPEDDTPAPLRIRRGTLGRANVPGGMPASAPTSPVKDRESTRLPKSRSSWAVHDLGDASDPFTTLQTPQNPARLSKVFSPLPAEIPSREPSIKESQPLETPTPSPSRKRALPMPTPTPTALRSPRTILNSPSAERPGSPAVSEAGLSSVYDSYNYTHTEAPSLRTASNSSGESESDSTVTLTTLPTTVGGGSPARSAAARLLSRSPGSGGRASRVGFRVPDYHQAAPPRLVSDSSVSRYSQDDADADMSDEDQVPPLQKAATLKSSKSVRLSTTVAELRRMNSQISTVSVESTASNTLPAMRGGGFSPGRQGGGGKNYLSLGGGLLRSPEKFAQPSASFAQSVSPIRRSTITRSRRGTVVLQGRSPTKQDPESTRDVLREGSPSKLRASGIKHTSQLLTQATRLRYGDAGFKRGSVESLYDQQGFLK